MEFATFLHPVDSDTASPAGAQVAILSLQLITCSHLNPVAAGAPRPAAFETCEGDRA